MLASLGFDGATEVSMKVFSQLLSCHVCKLGYLLGGRGGGEPKFKLG